MLKRAIIVLAGFIAILTFTAQAQAGRGFIQYSYGTYVTKVMDLQGKLPATSASQTPDLGWRHERTAVFGMPLWGTTEGQYVLYTEAGDGWRSIPVPPEALGELGRELGIELTGESPISIFSIMWGWIIVGPIALAGILGILKGNAGNAARNNETAGPTNAQLQAMAEQIARQNSPQSSSGQAMARPVAGQPAAFGKRR